MQDPWALDEPLAVLLQLLTERVAGPALARQPLQICCLLNYPLGFSLPVASGCVAGCSSRRRAR